MPVDFKLPDLGEGIHEAEIIAVKVKEGELVKEDQPIFEVETDKAVVEIPSPYSGSIAKIHVSQGQVVTVGSVMISFDIAGQNTNTSTASARKESMAEKAAVAPAVPRETAPIPALALSVNNNGRTLDHTIDRSRPVPCAPAVRRLARELGVDLYSVHASGKAGRVLKEDVVAFAQGALESTMQAPTLASNHPELKSLPSQTSTPMPLALGTGGRVEYPDFGKFGKVERIPLKSIRRKIAENMAQAWSHIPHVTTFDEADITETNKLISKSEKDFAARSNNQAVKLTLTVFAIKAIASALKLYPQFNSSLDENTGEIVIKHYYNIGVAVATDRGLIVPVIKDVDKKSFLEIATELADIAQKTRSGKVELERLQGGTFTLTNIGAIGGTNMAPMVNFPECAILGMARGKEKPVVREGKIEIGTILPLAMSFDHRLADGAEAAYFVQHVVKLLENPLKFILD